MKPQNERVERFMELMNEALQETGITLAAHDDEPLVVFDAFLEEPVFLEVQRGTDINIQDGRVVGREVFDNGDIADEIPGQMSTNDFPDISPEKQ